MRQADKLDGLADGVINNYMARALFDMSQGDPKHNPWAGCGRPDGIDPDQRTHLKTRLTDGQMETLKFVYSRYPFADSVGARRSLVRHVGANTDPSGSGLH